ncbi:MULTISPECIES: acyltransferase [unclassified Caballeronia]|uniref:acyltransferase family protein n=1 Tax=unclassified Caballeronia TaxID=2646786 RepID=UPI00285FEDE1|nr:MULTISPECIES: acyltransferase [unclassified Caballeronia]MDR5772068.1 acyltransferase [Caballeronia sp. LZ002]MDR5847502.1 acyltransferase [Caballeronia sp. LZ003]
MKGAGHSNNFDFIRVVAASLVIFSHQYGLMGLGEPAVFGGFSYGGLGVLIFFSISGYLVSQSWDRDPHVPRFALKRILRIFPGLICVALLMTFIMGPRATTLSHTEYFQSPETWDFLFGTATLWNLTDKLPGVFVGLHHPTVNSSLWTVPLELKWYGFLAVLGLFGSLRHRYVLPVTLLVLALCRFVLPIEAARHPLMDFGLCFMFGATMHVCRADIERYRSIVGPVLGCAAVGFWLLRNEYFALVIALPYVVVTFGNMSTPFVRRFGRFGDLSYGLYIYAFPIQQLIILHWNNSKPVWFNLMLSFVAISVMAFLSWHLVENPAMSLKRFLGKRRSTAMGSAAAKSV